MKEKRDNIPFFREDSGDGDEVEILEVVGIDEDDTAPGRDDFPDVGPRPGNDDEEDEDDSDAIFLSMDDEPEAGDDRVPTAGRIDWTGRGAPGPDAGAESDLSQRLRADYDNLRKRIDRERREYELHANSGLVADLLPILDNFERALGAQATPGAEQALKEGLVLIYRQFSETLRKEGLRSIEAVGQPFDPNLHEAVATEPGSDHPPNTIVAELQRGYLFQDRVLRPAMVKVSVNGQPAAGGSRGDDDEESR